MSLPVELGEIVAGRYRVERELGSGGMGVVFAAMHVHLEQRVALKFLAEDAATNPDRLERFAREARAAAAVTSEHAVRVLDVGMLGNGLPYIAMEFLEGSDLEEVVNGQGPLPIPEAVQYVLQACEALVELHALGIVHRDVKPANLFLTRRADGSRLVKVIDFGISKAASNAQTAASLTRTAAVMGSPRYMSPEQLKASRDVDARTDVWALGVTLYELLGGQSPFAGGTLPEICASVLKDPPRPLRESRADAPPALEAVIVRCLEKDPDARYQDLAELTAALVEFGTRECAISAERVAGVLKRAGTRGSSPPPSPEAAAVTLRPGPRSQPVNGHAATDHGILERIGDFSRVPHLAVDRDQMASLALGQRAGAFLALVDGASSIDELLDVCGLARADAIATLHELLEARIVVIDASPRPR